MSSISEISETLQLILSDECMLQNGTWICPKESEGKVLVILSKAEKYFSSRDATTNLGTEIFGNVNESLLMFEKSMVLDNLQRVVSILMTFIAFENDFIGHSTGRIFLALSQILPENTYVLPSFLHILWNISNVWLTGSLKYASIDVKNNIISDSYAKMCQQDIVAKAPELHYSNCIFSRMTSGQLLFPTLNRNWTAATRVILLLHRILKTYKEGKSSKFDIFLDVSKYHIRYIVSAFMFHVSPLDTVKDCREDVAVSSSSDTCSNASKQVSEKELFAGSWLQLLCSILHSLADQTNSMKDQNSLFILLKDVERFLPTVALFSLAQHDHREFDSSISIFLCHKYLMMMLRLSRWFTEYPSLAVVCVESLQVYASDLLKNIFFQDQLQLEYSILDSPFASTLVEMSALNQPSRSLHLKRYAVFLVFKAVISLRKMSIKSRRSDTATSGNISMVLKEKETTVAEKYVEFEKWLVVWLVMQIQSSCIPSCTQGHQANRLSLLFLCLFVDEDDLMLHVLLELFDFSELQSFAIDSYLDIGALEPQSLLALALEPMRLFAAFLSVVQYDHTVIVDYLIANDTGALCLQYLLLCLQTICSTWPEFFQMLSLDCCQLSRKRNSSLHSVTEACTSCVKKPKLSTERQSCSNWCYKNCLDIQGVEQCRGSSSGDSTCKLFTGMQEEAALEEKMAEKDICTLFDMKKCAQSLISLKLVIERMEKKHLFPYNASPLLKHLHIFQQLWERQLRPS